MGIGSIIDGVLKLVNSIIGLFKKTPREKAQDEVKDRIERSKENSRDVKEAMGKGAKGDTSSINDIINRD